MNTTLLDAAKIALGELEKFAKGKANVLPMTTLIETLRAAIKQALAAPVQEPVAWMYDWEIEGEVVRDWVSQDYDEAHSPTMGCHNIRALYTTPPAAPVQEPFCFVYTENGEEYFAPKGAHVPDNAQPLYTIPPAAQRTDDATYAAAEIAWRAGWAACRDAEFVGEEAEDEAWGRQGANVAKDTEAKPAAMQGPVECAAEIVADVNGTLSTRWADWWTPNEGDKLYTIPPAAQPAAMQQHVGYMSQARCFVHKHEATEAEAKQYGWIPVYTPPAAQRARAKESGA